jgi:hypothetical protein
MPAASRKAKSPFPEGESGRRRIGWSSTAPDPSARGPSSSSRFGTASHIEDLTAAEVAELGPLLQRVSHAVRVLAESDQVYVCLWSHAGSQAVHVHFVIQPAWNR